MDTVAGGAGVRPRADYYANKATQKSTIFATGTLNDLAYLLLFPEGSPHRQGYAIKRVVDGFQQHHTRKQNDLQNIIGLLFSPNLTDAGLWLAYKVACENQDVMADVLSNVVDEQTAGLLIPAAKAFLKEHHKD